MSDKNRQGAEENFFIEPENINHLDENSVAELKSRKEYKEFHEQGEQESKKNFYEVYYDPDNKNDANKRANKKNQYDGIEEEKILQAKYESGSYAQNAVQDNFIVEGLTSVNAFLIKYRPAENKIQAIKFILNLGNPENKLSREDRAQILKDYLGFKDEEIKTVQKFENYRSVIDNKEDIKKISVDEFRRDNENYVSLAMRKTGVSQQNQNMIINNIRNMNLINIFQNNWNLMVFSSFYNQMSHLYNTQIFNMSQAINVVDFNKQTRLISSNISGTRNFNRIPKMQPVSNLNHYISNINNDDNNFRQM